MSDPLLIYSLNEEAKTLVQKTGEAKEARTENAELTARQSEEHEEGEEISRSAGERL